MNRFRIGLIIGAITIIIAELILTDYDNLKLGSILVVISMILLIISLVLGIKSERKN